MSLRISEKKTFWVFDIPNVLFRSAIKLERIVETYIVIISIAPNPESQKTQLKFTGYPAHHSGQRRHSLRLMMAESMAMTG